MSSVAVTADHAPAPKGHPAGLWVLFVTEMWERFSYYGMRALLVFYLISKVDSPNPGLGWTEEGAGKLYGAYTALVYLTPVAGGWLADKFLGTHRSMLVGGWIIAAGHFTLALTELFGHGPIAVATFMLGLVLIIVGTGFFKPCVSVMVGQLYGEGDPRRDSAFTIFYMGINVGAFMSGLIAGTLGEKIGWHYGFGSAGVGMVLGLIIYQLFRPKYLGGIGLSPKEAERAHQDEARASAEGRSSSKSKIPEELVCAQCHLSLGELPEGEPCPDCGHTERTHMKTRDLMSRPLSKVNWHRIGVIFVLAIFVIFFWAAFEQAGTSLNVFALDHTDRSVGSFEFPATWYQSVNPLIIVLFAPVFAWMWVALDRRGMQPRTPTKFAMGLMLLGLGFVFMVIAGLRVAEGDKAGPQWLLLAYLFHTWGELCLSPVGLSMVTKLAPVKIRSLMMGLWFLSNAVSNLVAGLLFAYSAQIERGVYFTLLGGKADFFLVLTVAPFVAGLVVLALSPLLKRMMHGLH
jgi:proton-dependent oligopeptide transporter, POT family